MADNPKARGANFSTPELNQLVTSWLHVSQDPIVGNGQKLGAFWDRTLKHYNENRPFDREARNTRSLETKWSEVKRDVAKFAGCFQTVEDANQFGTTLEDTIRKAKELYIMKDPKGKSFLYSDQWLLLKDCRRFSMTVDDMNQKAAQKKARKQKGKGKDVVEKENDCPNVENVIDLDPLEPIGEGQLPVSISSSESLHFGKQRPMGNKIAKKARADESSTKIMATAQRDMAIISAKRLRLAEKHDRDTLLTLRVADVDPECQEYFHLCRAKELWIAMAKLQREEEEEMRALMRGTIRTPLPVAPSAASPSMVDECSPTIAAPYVEASVHDAPSSDFDDCNPTTPRDDFPIRLAELDRDLA